VVPFAIKVPPVDWIVGPVDPLAAHLKNPFAIPVKNGAISI